MLVTILEQDKQAAVREVQEYLIHKYEELRFNRGWSFTETLNAPETFEDLVLCARDKCIPIYSGDCESSVWGKKHNILLRFWHDVTHLSMGLGFSYESEKLVIEQQIEEARPHLSNLALNMLYSDMQGQNVYYKVRKEFVSNQAAFIDSCLSHGINNAVRVKH